MTKSLVKTSKRHSKVSSFGCVHRDTVPIVARITLYTFAPILMIPSVC